MRFPRHPYLEALRRDPLILPFYVPAVAIAIALGLLTPVLPYYAEGFGVSYGWVGALTAAQALGALLTDLPSGLLIRRLGQRRAMLLGLLVIVLASFGLAWAGSIATALIYRFVSGFGLALFGVARHVYISEHTDVARRGKALSLFGGMMRVGQFVGPMLGGAMAASWGTRVPFAATAILGIPAVICVGLFARDRTATAPVEARVHTRDERQARRSRLWTLLFERAGLLAPAGIGQIFAQMIRSGRNTIIPLYAAGALGLDVDRVGLLMGIAAAVELVMFVPAGWLMDNVGRKYAIVPSFTIQAVAMGLVPLTGGFAGLLACATAIGAGNGLSSGAMMVLGTDLAPPGARSEFLGVWRFIGDLGGTGGPAAVGLIADAMSLPAAALSMGAAGLAAAVTFGAFLPETLRGPAGVSARTLWSTTGRSGK
jgi:MFS family permease